MKRIKTAAGSDYGAGLISTKDAAKMIGVSSATLGNWRRRGHGPRCHVFGEGLGRVTVKYREADVKTYLEGTEVAP